MTDLQHLREAKSYFELFEIPRAYNIDRSAIETRYLELTRLTHPDFAGTDPEAQIQALELSARVNEAYATLTDDLRRAEYLLELHGQAVSSERLRVSPETLERVFELREALSLAQSSDDEVGLGEVRDQAKRWLEEVVRELASKLNAGDFGPGSAELVHTARYIQKIIGA